MDQNRDVMRKSRNNGNVLLLTVLIGFCILAIIEIVYGQAQIRMERERLALEEENHQTVQELKTEWNNLRGDPSVGTEFIEEVGEEQSGIPESEKMLTNTDGSKSSDSGSADGEDEPIEDDREYAMQIVFMGDSIMDNERDTKQDVPSLVGEVCNAKVYNMAIGGTTAALLAKEHADYDTWSSIGLLGMVNAILGNIDPDIFDGYEAGEILKVCDFSKTDYFVIEYGLNDFSSRQIPQSRYLANGDVLGVDAPHTYAGALDLAVNLLQNSFPDARILIISPHYCQIFEGNTFVGDAYSLNYGYGTVVEFSRIAEYVAEQHKTENTFFFNAFEQSGIDAYTADKYLDDGIHLSNEGRRVYADCIVERILKDFYPEE